MLLPLWHWNLPSFTMKTVATGSFEMLASLYQTTQDSMFVDCSLFHNLGGMRLGPIALQLPYQIRITDEQTSYKHSKNLKKTSMKCICLYDINFNIFPLSSYFLKYCYSFQTQTTSSIYSRCSRETSPYDYSIHQQMATSSGYYDTSSQCSTSFGQPTYSSGWYLLLCWR